MAECLAASGFSARARPQAPVAATPCAPAVLLLTKRFFLLQAWDTEFVKVDQSTLFDLILAANYLNIKSLLDLTCHTVAQMIKGKTPEVRLGPFSS